MDYEAFAAGMRLRRLRKKWGQRHLAKLIGTNQPYVSQIENGRRKPSLKTLMAICAAFELETHTAIEREGQEHLAKEKDGESIKPLN